MKIVKKYILTDLILKRINFHIIRIHSFCKCRTLFEPIFKQLV